MTRMAAIKAKYDASKLSYEDALDQLEALGMWAGEADDYLVQPASTVTSQSRGTP